MEIEMKRRRKKKWAMFRWAIYVTVQKLYHNLTLSKGIAKTMCPPFGVKLLKEEAIFQCSVRGFYCAYDLVNTFRVNVLSGRKSVQGQGAALSASACEMPPRLYILLFRDQLHPRRRRRSNRWTHALQWFHSVVYDIIFYRHEETLSVQPNPTQHFSQLWLHVGAARNRNRVPKAPQIPASLPLSSSRKANIFHSR